MVLSIGFKGHDNDRNRTMGDAFFDGLGYAAPRDQVTETAMFGSLLFRWFQSEGAYHYQGSLS